MPDELLDDALYRLDLGYANVYLVDHGDVSLVDTGMPGDLGGLRRELAAAGYAESDLDRILLTHYDLDHVGTLADLAVDGPIYAVEPDAGYVDGSRRPPLTRRKGLLQRVLGRRISRPSTPVQRLADGDAVGGFRAYHTPGHTPGHAVYVHEDLDAALLGDLVVADDGRLRTPPWYFAYSARENARSVRALADRNLGFSVAAPGHGRPLATDGARALADLAGRLG